MGKLIRKFNSNYFNILYIFLFIVYSWIVIITIDNVSRVKHEESEVLEIHSLRQEIVSEGRFIFGSGSMKSKTGYVLYIEDDDNIKHFLVIPKEIIISFTDEDKAFATITKEISVSRITKKKRERIYRLKLDIPKDSEKFSIN